MPTVDSKGRITLPKRLRDRLGIDPGTEVEVHEDDGRVVVEPADDPEEILDRMEVLIAETAPGSGDTTPLDADVDPVARKHRDAVRSGAERGTDE